MDLRTIVSALRSSLGFIMVAAFLDGFASANLEAAFALFTKAGLSFSEGETIPTTETAQL